MTNEDKVHFGKKTERNEDRKKKRKNEATDAAKRIGKERKGKGHSR